MVTVSILAVGEIGYGLAAREAILSVLDHTDFDVHVTCDGACGLLVPESSRVKKAFLAERIADHRADRFLAKFTALRSCLQDCSDPILIQLDADAVMMQQISAAQVEAALGSSGLAMVEQTTTAGSEMRRPQFLRHYCEYSLRFIAPELVAPSENDFRYYNSGVVLFRREALIELLDWAEGRRKKLPSLHEIGVNMIADQDYLQVWANNVCVGSCGELSWDWNHCELWDEGFPRSGAKIAHMSNFCNGPTGQTIENLRVLRGAPGTLAPNPLPHDLTFVIVTYNSERFLDASLAGASRLGRVVVVDNASRDRSLAIAERWNVKVVSNEINEGFAKAANAGAEVAQTQFVCFLNPDCFVTEAAVEAALAALSSDPRQLVVPEYVNWSGHRTSGQQPGYSRTKVAADLMEAGGHWNAARRLRRLRSHHDHSWAWPLAACLFVDRGIFFELGGFDSSYFCYMEDVVLGRWAAQNGVPTVGLQQSVLHLERQGAAMSSAGRNLLLDAARLQFATDAYGTAFVFLVRTARRLLRLVREAHSRLRRLAPEFGS